MAEFKLGRIRFVWKSDWATGTTYYKDDVVKYGGKVFICITGHPASASFYTDLDATPSKWNQLSDGFTWENDWTVGTDYKTNDMVKYGGRLYVCRIPHTSAATLASGLEADLNLADSTLSKWDNVADGIDWKGNWTVSTRYKVNDVVKYGGINYICNTYHTSAASISLGLETDLGKWDVFNRGVEYRDVWTALTRYRVNDVVKYGGTLYICTLLHTSTSDFGVDINNWSSFVEGLQFENTWSSATSYQPGDIVRYGGNQYVAITVNLAAVPSTATADWNLFSRGFSFTTDWSNATSYKVGEVVRLNGYTYLCILDHSAQTPPSATYWTRLNSGILWKGEWSNSTPYYLGDTVRYMSNVYICVQNHTSNDDDSTNFADSTRSPSGDTEGVYWNIFNVGNEYAVMTNPGDMVYYNGDQGPARLPIGVEGQVLKVTASGNPDWDYLGVVDQNYYVGNHGVDLPAPIHGRTADKPWKTVRYALEQIEKGPRNPVAQRLLEMNRVFIQREVTEWIARQIISNASPFTTSFVYDEFKCERDVGFVIDRVIHDIGHGGNLKTLAAALSYINALDGGLLFATAFDENGTGTYSLLTAQKDEDIAAYNYMLTVIGDVLSNQAPQVNYQVLNGDNSTAIVPQFVDADLVAETGVLTTITNLVGIVTTALADGTTTNLPDRTVPASLLNVKSGSYSETLPMIVPTDVCVLGDEKRAVTVSAAGSLVDVSDAYYTVDTFNHVQSIVEDIVTGTTITPTTGNNLIQSISAPFADAAQATVIGKLVEVMKQQSDFRLGTMHLASLTDPTGYNVSYLVGYGDARKLIKENKKFFQEEVVAYMVANYPTLSYGKVKTRRDAGYIVDAVIYDLTYGGNALSVKAGLAYYDGDDNTLPQLPTSIKAPTLAALAFLKDRLQAIAVNTPVTPLQTTVVQFRGTAGAAGTATFVGARLDEIITIINTGPTAVGTTVTLTDPTPTNAVNSTTALISAYSALDAAATTIRSNTISFINSTYPTLVYNETKCSRDVGIILKAVGYDFMFNATYQSLKAAHAYLRLSASEVYTAGQKTITIAALEYARTQAIANVGSNATAIARINSLMELIKNVIYSGSTEGDMCQTESRNTDWAILQLERNRDFIVAEVSAYIADTYIDTVTAATAATDVFTCSNTSWMKRNVAVRFTGTTFGGVTAGTTYYIQDVVSSTTFKIATSRNTTTALDVLANASGSMTVVLHYNTALCERDVGTYIDALKWDLKYTSNYKSIFVARYYANAVTGSQEEDMYYLRNGTGLRNMTLRGLEGDLTPPNAYGTSRVTSGAYASLDPGWGPADFRTWITARSPYIQNLATFGNAAVGQKIDGALHNGGNKSITSNDFTQLISDGIGAWITNNGRAELVSVFTYYSHIGYLAENGGRIRGTNGNNSYGDFGSVAEGFDATETIKSAIVDNRYQYKSVVGTVTTDGAAVYRYEFDHAGNEYTEADWLLIGPGNNAAAYQDEFRDDAVYQVRMIDNVDDSTSAPEADGNQGGFGYVTNTGTAQNGTSTSITLSATDNQLSTAYIGMMVHVTSGNGIGQYAIINTYDAGTKVAAVIKETTGASGWDHQVPGTTIVSPDSSSSYLIEPRISFTSPTYSAAATTLPTSGAWTAVAYGNTATTYTSVTGTYSGAGTSASFMVVRNGSKYQVTVQAGGTGYVRLQTITILGTSVGGLTPTNDIVVTITSVNSVTGAIQAVDFDGYGLGGRFVAVRSGSVIGATSENGTDWTTRTSLMPSGANWSSLAFGQFDDGSSLNRNTRFVAVAGTSANTTGAYSEDGITWTSSTMVTSATWVDVVYGEGRFVAIASDTTAVRISLDGETWDLVGALPATGFTAITYGMGLFVAVKSGGTAAASSVDGVTWSSRTLPSSSAWNDVSWGNGRFVAISNTAGSTVAAYSLNGVDWTASTLPAVATWTKIAYGQGMFYAVSTTTQAASSPDGVHWTSRTTGAAASGFTAITHGNPQRIGSFAAIGSGTSTVAGQVFCGATTKARAYIASQKIAIIRIVEPGSGYASAPTITITDPNNIYEAPTTVRLGDGVLANPSFINRGTGYQTCSAEIDTGDGYADFFQDGAYIAVRRISSRPAPGANLVFAGSDITYKVVSVVSFRGEYDGAYTAFFQVSPVLKVSDNLANGIGVTTRIRYSQVRLTGHDFLDIGTGGFSTTNYPNHPTQDPIQANETVEGNGGRVFFTSTDQDGNFRVGDLFTIEQSTGIATLNADAFNISGLQELSLGNLSLGGASAAITEFSTDPFFTADSDSVVPTQRAIKAYIASQIGGGGASLIVNSVTAGDILIGTNQITNVTGGTINFNATVNFTGGLTGSPLALSYFLN